MNEAPADAAAVTATIREAIEEVAKSQRQGHDIAALRESFTAVTERLRELTAKVEHLAGLVTRFETAQQAELVAARQRHDLEQAQLAAQQVRSQRLGLQGREWWDAIKPILTGIAAAFGGAVAAYFAGKP